MSPDEVVKVHISEQPVPGRLGRHVHHDPRSRGYSADRAPELVSVKHEATGLPLNQGEIGSCTANALCGALNSAPFFQAGASPLNERDAIRLYEAETKLEGDPYPPNDPGGSGLMVCEAAKQMGMITSYNHAFGLEHALAALVLTPVITGIKWYTSFDSPDPETGLVQRAEGDRLRGGHEIVADEIDAPNELVWFWNSWGVQFGLGGRFCMKFATWGALLEEQGDVTVPVKE